MRFSNLLINFLLSIDGVIASPSFYNIDYESAFIKNASRKKDQHKYSWSRLPLYDNTWETNKAFLAKQTSTSPDIPQKKKTHNAIITLCNENINHKLDVDNLSTFSVGAFLYAIEQGELIQDQASQWSMLPLSTYFVDMHDFEIGVINEEKNTVDKANKNDENQTNNDNNDCPPDPDDTDFDTTFSPEDMRCLALVADNKMKPALRKFVQRNRNLLKKFRLTGTSSTMAIVREVFGDDPSVIYGPTCKPGPLGGNAELCAYVCRDQLGAVVFFQDPMDAHPHQADIECLCRQALVHNVLMAANISSADSLMCILRLSLKSSDTTSIRSFFSTEYSPSVLEYKRRQGEIARSFIDNKIEREKTEDMKYFTRRTKIPPQDIAYADDADFDSAFEPEEMRCLALVAHNHMKPAMRDFIKTNKNLLKKFRLTGTNTTMAVLREVYGDDPDVVYGPSCQSGPLGGDAELCAQMCLGELGGIVFFQDPMDTHPHQADIACLNRQANIHDVIVAHNPHSAYAMTEMMRHCLERGVQMPSFFETKKSPSVAAYTKSQSEVLNETSKN